MSNLFFRLRYFVGTLNRSTIIGIIAIAIIFLATPFTVLIAQKQQDVRQRASMSTLVSKIPDQIFSYNYPLSIKSPIYNFSLNGDVSLKSNNSFLRVILVDKNNHEYLVYETYPAIADQADFSINNECEETCILGAITPDHLRIEGNNSSINNIKTSFSEQYKGKNLKNQAVNLIQEGKKVIKEKNDIKIQKINQHIARKKLRWKAGETSVSQMTYAQKKKLFSNPDGTPVDKLPNLQGFEYYIEGVFEIGSLTTPVSLMHNVVAKWDWRNVHGENWMSPVRNQGSAGTCWAFANIGAFESLINLYFNQRLNIDLSEQMLVDCSNNAVLPLGMSFDQYPQCTGGNRCYPGYSYCVESLHGISDEQCDPYVQRDTQEEENYCTLEHICSNWQDRIWKISDFYDYKFGSERGTPDCPKQTMDISEDEFKKVLIKKGPMNSAYFPWGHAMVLVGYELDPLDNRTVWVYKNSWGTWWGEQGYAKIKASLADLGWGSLPLGPVIPPKNQSYKIACNDKDRDGYCNWGISETKPSTCPASCRPEKDCDDSNPNIQIFDANYNCLPAPTHRSCINKKCQVVTGSGSDTCRADIDCAFNTPTPRPTTKPVSSPNFILNSASGKSCNQICQQNNKTCQGVSHIPPSLTNNAVRWLTSGGGYCAFQSANCSTVMTNNNKVCAGGLNYHLANWVYCKCVTPTPTSTPIPIANSLIGHWKLDNVSGTTAPDSSGYNHPGTLMNNPAIVTGSSCLLNKCLSFNGSNNFVQISGGVADTSKAHIYSLWAYPKRIYANMGLFGDWFRGTYKGSMIYDYSTSGRLCAYTSIEPTSDPNARKAVCSTPSLNQWHHFAVTYDGVNKISYYVDGSLVGTITQRINDEGNFYIGTYSACATCGFNGLINDARVYNYARTAAQVRQDYNEHL